MEISSRTTEGLPSRCPVCGKKVWIDPSSPQGDATCPHCGHLLWFTESEQPIDDDLRRLSHLGVDVETDEQDEIRVIRFRGSQYDDSVIDRLASITGVVLIDLRGTNISPQGVERLRHLLPETTIVHSIRPDRFRSDPGEGA